MSEQFKQEIIPFEKPKRIQDKKYREWIARQYCIFCYLEGYGKNYNTMCCHWSSFGVATKCSDYKTFSGCHKHHSEYDAGRDKMLKRFGDAFNIEFYFEEMLQKYIDQTGNEIEI